MRSRLAPADERAVPEVVLQPHARLGHPRAVNPGAAVVERGLGLVHRPPRGCPPNRSSRARATSRELVRAGLPARADDPLLDLGHSSMKRARGGAPTAGSGRATTSCEADPVAVSGQFSWSPAGSYSAVSGRISWPPAHPLRRVPDGVGHPPARRQQLEQSDRSGSPAWLLRGRGLHRSVLPPRAEEQLDVRMRPTRRRPTPSSGAQLCPARSSAQA